MDGKVRLFGTVNGWCAGSTFTPLQKPMCFRGWAGQLSRDVFHLEVAVSVHAYGYGAPVGEGWVMIGVLACQRAGFL